MLYDVYEKRILKLARILDFLRRNARTLLIALTVVVVTTTTLLATKGIAGKTTCEATYTYGETVSCDGGAFLSRVHFEYKGADGTWSETPPRFPGAYLVRSVGFSITGKPRYGKETPFTILPRTVDVQVSDTHICYGELPSVSAELPFGDRVLCDSVAYANILHTSTTVTPNKDAVRIIAANGSDVTSAYEICTVSTDITFDGREISLTVSDATHVYDALSFFYKEYELSGGTLAEGDTLQATFDQSLVDVGSTKNQPSWRILNKQSQDVTHHYRINETVGNLTVEQRPLVISTGNTIGTYNAEAHSQKSYSLAQGTTLVTGHRLGVVSFTAAIDAGVHENQLGFCVLDASGRDVTANYAILVECGTIEISPRTVMASTHSGSFVYDGTAQTHKSADVYGLLQGHTFDVTEATSLTDVGAAQNLLTLCIFAADGTDVTHNYDISFTYYGTLIVTERPVVLRTASDSWIYDGEPHYTHELEPLSELRLVEGHEIVVMEGTTITEAGTLPNEIVAYRVVDKDGNDMDANYSIKIESGTLTVEKRPVILRPADTEYVYDGLPHGGGAPILSETSPYGLVKGHEVTATVTGTQTDVGTALSELLSPAIKAGNTDMTHNYDISVTEGSITVTPRPIFIVITDADKIYDGTPLTSNAFTVEPVEPHTFALVEGHRVTDVVTTSSQTDAGSSENDFASCLVTDGTRDVTHNYECRGIAGMLTVTPRPITVISGSAEKAYDGTPLVCHDPILLTKGSLVLDHYLDMQATGTLTEVGTVPNTIEGTMRDGSDTDVGKNYKITYDRGTLKVLPRALILVTTGSASAPYTGTPLVCEEVVYTFLSGDLLEGHLITVVTTGSQTEIGQSYNTFDITITDQLGEDVSRFYDIEKSLGLLEVYEPEEDEEGGSGGGGSGEGGSGEGGSGGGGSGGGYGGNLDDSGGLKDNHRGEGDEGEDNEDKSVVLLIKSDHTGRVYFRLKSFGDFTGQDFHEAEPYHLLLDGSYSYNYLTGIALRNAGMPRATMEIQSFTSQYLLPYYLGLGRDDYELQTSDVRHAGTGLTEYSLQYYIYDGTGIDLQGMLDDYSEAELAYRSFVYEQYLTIDDATRIAMEEIIAAEGFDLTDPDVVSRVAAYIRNAATYTKDYNAAIDEAENAVLAFLEYKEGVCRQYAAAGTMLFRALGIPARYTIGYVSNTVADEWAEVSGQSGHAWVEIYVDGVGWLPVEVTSGGNGGEGEGGSGGGGSGGGGGTPSPDDKQKIELTPTYQSKTYDGAALQAKNEIDVDPVLYELLLQEYTYTVTVSGEQTEIGCGKSLIVDFVLYDPSGTDVTDLYEIVYNPGVLEVFPPQIKAIHVYLYQLQKYYDGTPLAFEAEDFEILSIEEGLTLDLTLHISLTDVGYLSLHDINTNLAHHAEYRVLNGEVDVTEFYRVIFTVTENTPDSYVPIRVDPRPIELTAKSAEKVYDGTPLVSPGISVSMGKLLPGHYVAAVSVAGALTQVGEAVCDINIDSVRILDLSGADMTHNYGITTKQGKLTVLPSDA